MSAQRIAQPRLDKGHRANRRRWRSALFLLAACGALACIPAITLAASRSVNLPTGTRGLVMVDKLGSRVRFFDPATNRELSSLSPSDTVGARPHELAISPYHQRAYVSVYGDGVFGDNPHPGHRIAIIDLRTRKMTGSIDIAPYQAPHGIQVDLTGTLYVVCDLSHKLLVIDPLTRRIRADIDVGAAGHWLAVLPDASKAYVSSHGDQPFISVIDLKAHRMSDKVPVPNGSNGLALSPDGQTLLAADTIEPYLHVISTATDLEIGRIRIQDADRGLYKLFYSPDGRWVLTCLPSGQINILDAADLHGPQRVLHSAGTALMGMAFSADGRTALVGNHGEGTVTRIDLGTGAVLDTFPAGQGVETLAYF